MAQQVVNDGEDGLIVRNKINENFTEVYLYEPIVQPVVVAGVLNVDLKRLQLSIFNPRALTGTRTIAANFSWTFSNTTGVLNTSQTLSLTGVIIIDFSTQGNVKVSNPSSVGVWNDIAETLTITASVDDIIEFNFLYDSTSLVWDLKVGEVRV